VVGRLRGDLLRVRLRRWEGGSRVGVVEDMVGVGGGRIAVWRFEGGEG
jgi:hypothetical protein